MTPKENSSNQYRTWDRWWIVLIITIVSLVFGAGGATMAWRKDIQANTTLNLRQDQVLNSHNGEIETLKIDTARINEKLDYILKSVDEIKLAITPK